MQTNFFSTEFKKKISQWRLLRHLLVVGWRLMINQVLVCTWWFFNTWKPIKNIKGLLKNYLWGGQLGHVIAQVAWNDCCSKCSKNDHTQILGILGSLQSMGVLHWTPHYHESNNMGGSFHVKLNTTCGQSLLPLYYMPQIILRTMIFFLHILNHL